MIRQTNTTTKTRTRRRRPCVLLLRAMAALIDPAHTSFTSKTTPDAMPSKLLSGGGHLAIAASSANIEAMSTADTGERDCAPCDAG